MIGQVIKKSATDVWDELLYMIVFNVVWLVGIMPGFIVIVSGATASFLPLVIIGVLVFWIPLPFATFGLFGIAKDIGDGKGIKFGNFFSHARRMWKPAYIWGGINLVVFVVLWINLNFYGSIEARWAAIAQLFFVAVAIFWVILQLLVLGVYPRLVEPGFKLALRNAAVIMARQPLMILVLLVVIALFIVATRIFAAITFLLPFSVTAVVANNIVETVVSEELERQQAGE